MTDKDLEGLIDGWNGPSSLIEAELRLQSENDGKMVGWFWW
jgi:hypothetical protein